MRRLTKKEKAERAKENAEKTATKILDAFRNGQVPEAMKNVFLTLKSGRHSASWSLRNQFIMFIHGYSDARGYGQWKEAGRQVIKNQKAFHIFRPRFAKVKDRKDKDKEELRPIGFALTPVFGLEQTDGPEVKAGELENWIAKLPLMEVAKAWGIKVQGGTGSFRALGACSQDGKNIGLAVENLSTWAHEMVHAADIKLGTLTEKKQHWRSETVAELGGCILLECLGYETNSDRGGCLNYIKRYAIAANKTVQEACMAALDRTLKAVELLLKEAEKMPPQESEKIAT